MPPGVAAMVKTRGLKLYRPDTMSPPLEDETGRPEPTLRNLRRMHKADPDLHAINFYLFDGTVTVEFHDGQVYFAAGFRVACTNKHCDENCQECLGQLAFVKYAVGQGWGDEASVLASLDMLGVEERGWFPPVPDEGLKSRFGF